MPSPLQLSAASARVFIPDGMDEKSALARVTHLGIGAHQDDLEFMAVHGILECFDKPDQWFGGVTCTDGGGSARTGAYAELTDAEMQAVRLQEQEKAASVGGYGAMIQLMLASSTIKTAGDNAASDDLYAILEATRPRVVYTHQPADKHPTHIAVLLQVIAALRRLPPEHRPEKVYGCEVWRGLDWVADDQKIALDVSEDCRLAAALADAFDSQIAGGKRYDLAVEGRKRANATFLDAHHADAAQKVWYALDLTPLVSDPELSIHTFIDRFLSRFADDVHGLLSVPAK